MFLSIIRCQMGKKGEKKQFKIEMECKPEKDERVEREVGQREGKPGSV